MAGRGGAVRADADHRAPRERILAAARDLFYQKGIRAVSVDDIAAEADTNKMTLYRHFESKDVLVAECLRALAREMEAGWSDLERSHGDDPEAQLSAWIERVGEVLTKNQGRGCAFANAAVELPDKEHPARAVIEAFKTRQIEKLVQLCRGAGFLEPARLAEEIFLLLEGARIDVQTVGTRGPGARFAAMAQALIKTHKRRKR